MMTSNHPNSLHLTHHREHTWAAHEARIIEARGWRFPENLLLNNGYRVLPCNEPGVAKFMLVFKDHAIVIALDCTAANLEVWSAAQDRREQGLHHAHGERELNAFLHRLRQGTDLHSGGGR